MEKWELEMIKDLLRRQAEEWRRFVEESEADADAYPELSKIAAQLAEPTCPVCIVDAANSIICKEVK